MAARSVMPAATEADDVQAADEAVVRRGDDLRRERAARPAPSRATPTA